MQWISFVLRLSVAAKPEKSTRWVKDSRQERQNTKMGDDGQPSQPWCRFCSQMECQCILRLCVYIHCNYNSVATHAAVIRMRLYFLYNCSLGSYVFPMQRFRMCACAIVSVAPFKWIMDETVFLVSDANVFQAQLYSEFACVCIHCNYECGRVQVSNLFVTK